jgi:hypothetical protein
MLFVTQFKQCREGLGGLKNQITTTTTVTAVGTAKWNELLAPK